LKAALGCAACPSDGWTIGTLAAVGGDSNTGGSEGSVRGVSIAGAGAGAGAATFGCNGERGVVVGEAMGGAIGGDAAMALVVPARATMKLVLHLGQRIFIPLSGMRRSSTSYGDLHETHSTLIMCLRSGLRDKTLRAYAKAQRETFRTRE
jgi:hypothetical protein